MERFSAVPEQGKRSVRSEVEKEQKEASQLQYAKRGTMCTSNPEMGDLETRSGMAAKVTEREFGSGREGRQGQ